jgi:hypothetical protein
MTKILSAQVVFLIIVIVGFSCNPSKEKTNELNNFQNKTENIIDSTTKSFPLISDELMDLVVFIDSSGFVSDTIRYNKTYGQIGNSIKAKPFYFNSYIFYELPFENTTIYVHNKWHEKTPKEHRKEFWLEFNQYEYLEKITSYFYSQKDPTILNDTKYYTDGLIEEWTFKDSITSLMFAKEVGNMEQYIFVNSGAYVFCKSNRVYIFHARAIIYYNSLKKFADYFSKKNNIPFLDKKHRQQ